jgi:hypothetical protein
MTARFTEVECDVGGMEDGGENVYWMKHETLILKTILWKIGGILKETTLCIRNKTLQISIDFSLNLFMN